MDIETIKLIRGKLGLSQEKFAARVGVTLKTMSRWERGKSKPSPLALGRLEEIQREVG